MKLKISKSIFLLVLILVLAFFGCNPAKVNLISRATESDRKITFYTDNYSKSVYESEVARESIPRGLTRREAITRVYNMGFSITETIEYLYPELNGVIEGIEADLGVEPIDSQVIVDTGEAVVLKEREGQRVSSEIIIAQLFHQLIFSDGDINIEITMTKLKPVETMEQNKKLTSVRSEFRTYINGVNQEGRIHNIAQALSAFNGLRVDPNERVSFNDLIGDTTEATGYKKAKVILNGKYADDFGGGVCQAASTLCNAILLAGLEVEKVRPHSLKVGYVMGSFDAMVSQGTSDFVFKNNLDTPIFIYTYATDYECGVKIFGAEKTFEIKRRNEKVEFDSNEYPNVNLKTKGYLDYFKDGELVRSVEIRNDTYYKLKLDEPSTEKVPSLEISASGATE